jgi:hypothetical protein
MQAAPVFVILIACFWLAVWGLCLLLTLRFVVILVAAGLVQGWKSLTGEPDAAAE